MPQPMIKICGITDPDMAERAVKLGAHFIGLIFHETSFRYVNINEAALIAHSIKKAGGMPVAVFVNHDKHAMEAICKATDIQVVQLHGALAREHHHKLPHHFKRIYVMHCDTNGEIVLDHGFNYLKPERDMVLIDHVKSGQGNMIPYQSLQYSFQFPWFIAGGLTPDNVTKIINTLQPNGVDVSSGVEIYGKKDLSLIQQFIQATRSSC